MKFLFILCFVCFWVKVQSDLSYSKCIDVPTYGSICLSIQERNCLKLSVSVIETNNDRAIYGPTQFSILEILQYVQSAGSQSSFKYCSPVNIGAKCEICGTFNNVEYQGNTVGACGNVSLSCFGFNMGEWSLDCFKITNCSLLSCGGNDCSDGRGECTSIGICKCRGDNVGYDCGLSLSKNCIIGNALTSGDVCLQSASLETGCNNQNTLGLIMSLVLGSNQEQLAKKYDLLPNINLKLEECQKSFKLPCQTCPYARVNYIKHEEIELCPFIDFECEGILESSYNLSCISLPLTQTNQTCTNATSVPSNTRSASGITIVVVALGVLALATLAYMAYRRREMLEDLWVALKLKIRPPRDPLALYPSDEEDLDVEADDHNGVQLDEDNDEDTISN